MDVTHGDEIELKNGKTATVFDARDYPKLSIRIDGYQYKALSYFHVLDVSKVEKVTKKR